MSRKIKERHVIPHDESGIKHCYIPVYKVWSITDARIRMAIMDFYPSRYWFFNFRRFKSYWGFSIRIFGIDMMINDGDSLRKSVREFTGQEPNW